MQLCKCFAPLIRCYIFTIKDSGSFEIGLCFSNTWFYIIPLFMVKASLGRATINHDSKMSSVPEALVSSHRPSFWLGISTNRQWMVISLTVPWSHVNQPSAVLSEDIKMGLYMLHSVGLTDDPREVLLILCQCPQNLFPSLISEVSMDEQRCRGQLAAPYIRWFKRCQPVVGWGQHSVSSRWLQLSTSFVRQDIQQLVLSHRKGIWLRQYQFTSVYDCRPSSLTDFQYSPTYSCGPRHSRKRMLGKGNDTPDANAWSEEYIMNGNKMWATGLRRGKNTLKSKQRNKSWWE